MLTDYELKEMVECFIWKGLTKKHWFEHVRLLIDVFLDLGRNDAAEACQWLIDNKKIPLHDQREGWGWWIAGVDKEHILGGMMVCAIDRINRGKQDTVKDFSRKLGYQLETFIEVWEGGVEPRDRG